MKTLAIVLFALVFTTLGAVWYYRPAVAIDSRPVAGDRTPKVAGAERMKHDGKVENLRPVLAARPTIVAKSRAPRSQSVEEYYGVVLGAIALSAGEQEKLVALVRLKDAGPMNIKERLRNQFPVTQEKLQLEVAAENVAIAAIYDEIRTFLGEERYRQFRAQEELLPACNTVERLDERMKAEGVPLSDEQTGALLKLFGEQKPRTAVDQVYIAWQAPMAGGSIDFDILMESRRDALIGTPMVVQAHAFLTLPQIEVMRRQVKLFMHGKR